MLAATFVNVIFPKEFLFDIILVCITEDKNRKRIYLWRCVLLRKKAKKIHKLKHCVNNKKKFSHLDQHYSK